MSREEGEQRVCRCPQLAADADERVGAKQISSASGSLQMQTVCVYTGFLHIYVDASGFVGCGCGMEGHPDVMGKLSMAYSGLRDAEGHIYRW